MRILYLCHRVPYPPNKGEKIRAFHQLRALGARHEVDLFTLADEPADMAHQSALARYCRSVTVSRLSRTGARLRALSSFLTKKPLTLPYFYSTELTAEIRKAILVRSYDRIFVYCSAMAQYVEGVKQIPVVTDLVDVDSDKWTQYAASTRLPFSAVYRREARCLREYERKICETSDSVLVTTEREAQLVREISNSIDVRVIPNGVDTEYFNPSAIQAASARPTITFTGDMSYFPNQDAVVFFARKVLPLIRKFSPEVRFLIVGRNPSRNVERLRELDGVEVTGFVPDVRAYLAQTHVVVAPFSIAAGIQNKILEAMAYSLPVVATSRTVRGLSAEVAEIVETGDSPEELGAKIVRFLRDPKFARDRGAEGRRRVAAAYDWDRNLDRLLQLIENPFGKNAPQIEAGPTIEFRGPTDLSRQTRQDSPSRVDFSGVRVLMLLTNAYDPDPRVRQEALALIRLGCQVRILAWDRDLKSPALDCVEGVEVERVFLSSKHGRGSAQLFYYAWLYLKMLRRGWRTRFDVIHCHDLDTLPLGFVLGRLKRTPIVYDAHESFPDMLSGSVHPIVQRAVSQLETFLIKRIDLLITVGEKLRGYFAERGACRSTVVGNWKRLEEFSRSDEQNLAIRRGLGIPDGALLVVCITQLLKDRKLEELLLAIDKCPAVYLIVGGRGALEDLVRNSALRNPRIRYVGFVSGTEIPDYTCASDVVYYGFDPENPNARFSAPNKLFEALAAGRPLITGDFGEIAHVVHQASCGIVLPEYSAKTIQNALTALQDSPVRIEMAQNAKRFGEVAMNWEKGETILYREYSALLPDRVRRPVSDEPSSQSPPSNWTETPSEVEVGR